MEHFEEDGIPGNGVSKRTIILDVGGERFLAMRQTLERYPATRLGKLMRASNIQKILEFCDEFVPGNPPEYFFDRNPSNFSAIITTNFLRSASKIPKLQKLIVSSL